MRVAQLANNAICRIRDGASWVSRMKSSIRIFEHRTRRQRGLRIVTISYETNLLLASGPACQEELGLWLRQLGVSARSVGFEPEDRALRQRRQRENDSPMVRHTIHPLNLAKERQKIRLTRAPFGHADRHILRNLNWILSGHQPGEVCQKHMCLAIHACDGRGDGG